MLRSFTLCVLFQVRQQRSAAIQQNSFLGIRANNFKNAMPHPFAQQPTTTHLEHTLTASLQPTETADETRKSQTLALAAVASANYAFFSDGAIVRIMYDLYDIDGPLLWDLPPKKAWEQNFAVDSVSHGHFLSSSVLRYDLPIAVSGWTEVKSEARSPRLGIFVHPSSRGCSYWRDADTGEKHTRGPGNDTTPGYQLCQVTDAQVFADSQVEKLKGLCEWDKNVQFNQIRDRCQCCQTNWEASIAAKRAVASNLDSCVKELGNSANEFMVMYKPIDIIAVFYTAFVGEPSTRTRAVCIHARAFLKGIDAVSGNAGSFNLIQLNLPFEQASENQNGRGQADTSWTTGTIYDPPFELPAC